ncbi:MAG: sensor histidine kinase [Ruminococcaceae bacterium]|nr:sensor histidine kinase [Oscillospiraceae bacterium]
MRELSLNVMDIAQNSVRAEATWLAIRCVQDTAAQTLTITLEDNGCGMSREQIASVTDPFFTTRTTRKVGLGVPLFKMAAEQTGGSFEITSTPGKGTVTTATFRTDHVDMTPLGDINSTVSLLINANPEMDFVFERKVDEKAFTLDTRQLREVLGDVPLNNPEVALWISSFLEENEKDLFGGKDQ